MKDLQHLLTPELKAQIDLYKSQKAEASRLRHEGSAKIKEAMEMLRDEGISIRDISFITGYSRSRVHQILHGK